MGFTFNNGAFGGVTNVYNIDCTNSPGMVLHLGLGRGSKANGSSPQTKRCPITKELGPELLCTSASSCKGSTTPPDGFNTETWGGSDAIFGGNAPVGLAKGATLFYWKEGASKGDIPDGYFGAYLKDGILVVHPVVSDDSGGDDLLSDADDTAGSPQDLSLSGLTSPGDSNPGNMGKVNIDEDDD